jgi:hypothetical protein
MAFCWHHEEEPATSQTRNDSTKREDPGGLGQFMKPARNLGQDAAAATVGVVVDDHALASSRIVRQLCRQYVFVRSRPDRSGRPAIIGIDVYRMAATAPLYLDPIFV